MGKRKKDRAYWEALAWESADRETKSYPARDGSGDYHTTFSSKGNPDDHRDTHGHVRVDSGGNVKYEREEKR